MESPQYEPCVNYPPKSKSLSPAAWVPIRCPPRPPTWMWTPSCSSHTLSPACSTVCRMSSTVEAHNLKIPAMLELFYTSASESIFVFPREYLPAAMLVSLLSVWVLVGLFFYLNRYTRRPYFNIWTAAWLFYALWLTLSLNLHNDPETSLTLMFKQWC